MVIQSWADLLVISFQQVWTSLIVFVIGLIVAAGLAALIERLVGMLKVDKALVRVGVEEYVDRAGLRLNSGRFLGQVVYWFIVITFLLAASSLLGFVALSGFLEKVLT